MKPPQKLKRLLRVKLLREGQPGQQLLKLYGYIYPRREETAACKLTSFFRQLTLVNDRDKALLENVILVRVSGRSRLPTSLSGTDSPSSCPPTPTTPSPST